MRKDREQREAGKLGWRLPSTHLGSGKHRSTLQETCVGEARTESLFPLTHIYPLLCAKETDEFYERLVETVHVNSSLRQVTSSDDQREESCG